MKNASLSKNKILAHVACICLAVLVGASGFLYALLVSPADHPDGALAYTQEGLSNGGLPYSSDGSSGQEYFYFEDPNVPLAGNVFQFAAFETPPGILLPVPTDFLASRLAWSLVNIILTVTGILVFVHTMACYVSRKKRELEDASHYIEGLHSTSEKKPLLSHDMAPVFVGMLSVSAVILFVFTQDMRLPMVLIDFWTIPHVAAFALKLLIIS